MLLTELKLRQLIRLVLHEQFQKQKIVPQKVKSLPFKEPDPPDPNLVDLLSNVGKTRIKRELSASDKKLISQRINQEINLTVSEFLSSDPNPEEYVQYLENLRKNISKKYPGDFESNVIDKKIKFLIDRHKSVMAAPSSHNDAMVRMILYNNKYKQEIRRIEEEFAQKDYKTNEKIVDLTGEFKSLEKNIEQLKQSGEDPNVVLSALQRLTDVSNELNKLHAKKMNDRREMHYLIKFQKQKMVSEYKPEN